MPFSPNTSCHYHRAIRIANVPTIGYKENTKEFFKGFLSKRITFVSAALDSATRAIGTLALTIISALATLATNGLDIIGNMARLRHPLRRLQFRLDKQRCTELLKRTLEHATTAIISLVGVAVPMGAVKIHQRF